MSVDVVLCTAPPDRAAELARSLVGEKLAACVNILPSVRSIYRWDGDLCDDEESLLVIKTASERVPALSKRLIELHPYDVPEVIALPVREGVGNAQYLQWVLGESLP